MVCVNGWLDGRLSGWLVGCMVGWSDGWLVGRLVGWLVGWSDGWLALDRTRSPAGYFYVGDDGSCPAKAIKCGTTPPIKSYEEISVRLTRMTGVGQKNVQLVVKSHRLVAVVCQLPHRSEVNWIVDHIDGNKANNR